MNATKTKSGLCAEAQMVIRKPVHEVFEALVDPKITTKFWFTDSTGRLEAGKTIRWHWAMYGASRDVAGIILNVVADHHPSQFLR